MQTARLPCRLLRAVHSFEPNSPSRRSLPILPITTSPRPLQTSNPHPTQIAFLRTRAPSEKYVLARRNANPHPVPSFRRKLRKDAAGNTTTTPKARTEMSVEELERELMWTAKNKPALARIKEILTILVEDRHQRPTPLYYEALVLGNCEAEHGSAANVRQILEEMKEVSVTVGAPVYNAALKVLSIHPDPDLRKHILDEMGRQWIRVDMDARNDIVAGLIREDEFEKALAEMDTVQQEGHSTAPWLNSLLMHALSERKDFEAVLRHAYRLHDTRTDLPRPMWLWLLQQASAHGDYYVTEWIWQKHVEPMYITPDGQTCVDALKICAEEGKYKLAESVHGILEALEPGLAAQQLELLHAAYEKAGVQRDPSIHKRRNMFSVFHKASGHDKAFFDPQLALRKQVPPKFTNSRRLEKSRAFKESLKRVEKLKRRHSRISR